MTADEIWNQTAALGLPYPEQPYRLGQSRCHWFAEPERQALQTVLAHLPEPLWYLELGSFLGAGSTAVVLEAKPQARLICVDHWLIQGEYAARHDLLADADANGLVAFVRGEGDAWQHFQNNTHADRHRVRAVRRTYSPMLMRQLQALGIAFDLILVDDDHREQPVLDRIRVLRELWPQAHLVFDDFDNAKVRAGFYRAVDAYLCPLEDCEQLTAKLMWVRPAAWQPACPP